MALISVLALLALPFFFAYLEAERLLGWPDALYRWFDPWLPLVLIFEIVMITIALPWLIVSFWDSSSETL